MLHLDCTAHFNAMLPFGARITNAPQTSLVKATLQYIKCMGATCSRLLPIAKIGTGFFMLVKHYATHKGDWKNENYLTVSVVGAEI